MRPSLRLATVIVVCTAALRVARTRRRLKTVLGVLQAVNDPPTAVSVVVMKKAAHTLTSTLPVGRSVPDG